MNRMDRIIDPNNRKKYNMINMILENERNSNKSDLNCLSVAIAVKLSHKLKDIDQADAYIDEICSMAKKLYRDSVSLPSGIPINVEIQR